MRYRINVGKQSESINWYKNYDYHRVYGPAIEYFYGKLWYINGRWYTEEEFKRIQMGKNEI